MIGILYLVVTTMTTYNQLNYLTGRQESNANFQIYPFLLNIKLQLYWMDHLPIVEEIVLGMGLLNASNWKKKARHGFR